MTIVLSEYMQTQLAADYSGGGFTPISLNPLLSLRANSNVYKDNAQATPATSWNDQVQQWRDEREVPGGNVWPYGNQATGSLRFTLAPQMTSVGGLLCFNQRLQLIGLPNIDQTNCTLVVSGFLFTDYSQLQSPVLLSFGTAAHDFALQLDGYGPTNVIQPDANYDLADHNASSVAVPQSPYQVLSLQSTGTGVVVQCNAQVQAAFTAKTASSVNTGYLGDWANLNSTLAGGFLARVLIYSPALSPSNLTTLQTFLAGEVSSFSLYPLSYPLIAFLGDSLTEGVGHGTITAVQTYPYQTRAGLTNPSGYLLAAKTGLPLDPIISAYAAGVNGHYLASGRTGGQAICLWAGTNDIAAGTTGAALYADTKTQAAALQAVGWKVALYTVMNNGGFTAGQVAQQGNFNSSIRADFTAATSNPRVFGPAGGTTYADALVDVQSEPNLQTTTNTTYFSDGTHLTALGYGIVATDTRAALALFGIT